MSCMYYMSSVSLPDFYCILYRFLVILYTCTCTYCKLCNVHIFDQEPIKVPKKVIKLYWYFYGLLMIYSVYYDCCLFVFIRGSTKWCSTYHCYREGQNMGLCTDHTTQYGGCCMYCSVFPVCLPIQKIQVNFLIITWKIYLLYLRRYLFFLFHQRLIKLTSPNLNYLLLLGAAFVFLSIILYGIPSTDRHVFDVLCPVSSTIFK